MNVPTSVDEYTDFMNEERRHILTTIRRANSRLGRDAETADLEEQERLDERDKYASLFDDEMP